jgi:malonyl-CoA O-methyltransferase
MPEETITEHRQIDLRGVFERAAVAYDRHAALEREVADRLLERVAFQRRTPDRIVDLGCGTGYCAAAVKRRYRKAEVIGLDCALAMCQAAQARSGRWWPLRIVCGDFGQLPLAGRSADLLVASLAFQWCEDFGPVFNELRRIMRPGGLLLFSCLGPASMAELRAASASATAGLTCRAFPDMHDIGDALVAAGFDEPVMDSESITLNYRSFGKLLAELEATGAASHFGDWAAVCNAADRLRSSWHRAGTEGGFPLSWEIVYGAAFAPAEGRPMKTARGDIATFSVESLRRARRHR